ncbi:WG repeat-containing protein [Chitinophaga rhizosphaerae]|uniref:WG repeat-containing protein n=1 Tax=Chitinophaga rhizosphaerae TaxID=1864947 RepID=UPI000F803709|nr:WG repeat-containing protein [Chitinophaga rhizosphaerae]
MQIIIYICTLMAFFLIGCQSKQQPAQQQQQSSSTGPANPKREKLAGRLDSVNNIWIADDKRYEPSGFEGKYASVSRTDSASGASVIGLINREGEIVVPIRYDGIDLGFSNGVNNVVKGDKYGLVNEDGVEVVPVIYRHIGTLVEDSLLRVSLDGEKFGMIDLQGKVVIPLEYGDVRSVGEGMVAVMKEPQRWGIMNWKREWVHPAVFTFTDRFVNGVVTLQKADGEDYLVYTNGEIKKK